MSKFSQYLFLFILVTLSGCVHLQTQELVEVPKELLDGVPAVEEKPAETDAREVSAEKPPQLKLPEYERLTYSLSWMGIKAGTITASIEGIREYKGRDAYVFQLNVRSNRWLSFIYNIDSTYTSYTDVEHFHSLYEEVDRKEGRYRKHAVVEFDQDANMAHFRSFTDGSEKSFPIPPDVLDGLASVYYFRTLDLKEGDNISYKVVLGEKIYDFYGDVEGVEMIRAGRFGRQEAIKVVPYGYQDGEQVKEGSMVGYFAPHGVKVPLESNVKTPLFTSATATLTGMTYSPQNKD